MFCLGFHPTSLVLIRRLPSCSQDGVDADDPASIVLARRIAEAETASFKGQCANHLLRVCVPTCVAC